MVTLSARVKLYGHAVLEAFKLNSTVYQDHVFSLLQKWRDFCEDFKGRVEDYNYGTLLRLHSAEDYSQENSMFCKCWLNLCFLQEH